MQFATPSAKSTFLHSCLPWHLPLTFASVCSLIGFCSKRAENELSKVNFCLFVGWIKCLKKVRQMLKPAERKWLWRGIWVSRAAPPCSRSCWVVPWGSPWELMRSYKSASTVLPHCDHSNRNTISSSYCTSVSYWDHSCSTVPMQ